MHTTFTNSFLENSFHELNKANNIYAKNYPGYNGERQPIHTVYGGAHLYKRKTCEKIGELALTHFKIYARSPEELARAVGETGNANLWRTVYSRVLDKLQSNAVEDYRIDFEDGFGHRSHAEEDEIAAFAAQEVAKDYLCKTLPPFIGIRIKSFSNEVALRAARTLDIFVSTLLNETKNKIPENFVLTLPKVSIPEQVKTFVTLLECLEKKHNLPIGSFRLEIMIETTQALIGFDSYIALPSIIKAAQGRCRGAHFGTYDYTASCDVTSAYQKMSHPSCDFALQVMKNSLAGTGIWLSDGATTVMPVPVHKAEKNAPELNPNQFADNLSSVHNSWKMSFENIMRSFSNGYYQGWDLHPGQIGIRYATCYFFFLQGLEQASTRLKNFINKSAQATLLDGVFDDAATGQGLLNYFLRALNCGAITENEILATGLTLNEIKSKSFVSILKSKIL